MTVKSIRDRHGASQPSTSLLTAFKCDPRAFRLGVTTLREAHAFHAQTA